MANLQSLLPPASVYNGNGMGSAGVSSKILWWHIERHMKTNEMKRLFKFGYLCQDYNSLLILLKMAFVAPYT